MKGPRVNFKHCILLTKPLAADLCDHAEWRMAAWPWHLQNMGGLDKPQRGEECPDNLKWDLGFVPLTQLILVYIDATNNFDGERANAAMLLHQSLIDWI